MSLPGTGSTAGPCAGSHATRIPCSSACGPGSVTMPEPAITFAGLRQLLLDRDFSETVVPRSHVAFRHDPSGTEILFPSYRPSQMVLPHHLATARILLDRNGLIDRE